MPKSRGCQSDRSKRKRRRPDEQMGQRDQRGTPERRAKSSDSETSARAQMRRIQMSTDGSCGLGHMVASLARSRFFEDSVLTTARGGARARRAALSFPPFLPTHPATRPARTALWATRDASRTARTFDALAMVERRSDGSRGRGRRGSGSTRPSRAAPPTFSSLAAGAPRLGLGGRSKVRVREKVDSRGQPRC